MNAKRVLSLGLIVAALWLTGCAGKVSGRFDMQQNFRTGVVVRETISE